MNIQIPHAVFLVRDGAINRRRGKSLVLNWEQFEFLPGALEGLHLFAKNGYKVVVFSKQESVAQGLLSRTELERLTQRMLLEVALDGGNIAQVYHCLHNRRDGCDCLGPGAGLLWQAIVEHGLHPHEIDFISDTPADLDAACEAGCRTMLLRRDEFLRPSCHETSEHVHVASNLREAAEHIVNRETETFYEILMEGLSRTNVEILR